MQPQQPAHVEADEPRSLGLDGGPHRFQAYEQPLPRVGDAGGIGGDEREARATRQRLPEPHPRMDAERFGRQRDLADQLCSTGLGRERGGCLQQLGAALQGDGKLKSRQKDAGDHDRTHVRMWLGWMWGWDRVAGASKRSEEQGEAQGPVSRTKREDFMRTRAMSRAARLATARLTTARLTTARLTTARLATARLATARLATAGLAIAGLVTAGLATAAPAAAAGPYVSLGDSYTAAPLVPSPTGNPILCGRSTNNYPSDVSRAINPSSFTDASCSSATTADMTQSQNLYGLQTNPPQFNALSSSDALVTVGIGGNDTGLIGVAEECAELDATHPTGTACKNHYDASGSDPNVAAINATGPKVASVIQGIHTRAQSARVLIVGYPDGLPVNGTSCWPLVPVSPATSSTSTRSSRTSTRWRRRPPRPTARRSSTPGIRASDTTHARRRASRGSTGSFRPRPRSRSTRTSWARPTWQSRCSRHSGDREPYWNAVR